MALSILCLSGPARAEDPASPSAPPATANMITPPRAVHQSLTFRERVHIYEWSVFSPDTILGPAVGAAIGQWNNEPPGWEQGGAGYGRRLASGVGRNVISKTISFGFASVDGEIPGYHPAEDRSVWGRSRHAIVSTFVSETTRGQRMPAFSRFAGIYSAAFISNTWYPDNRATPGNAAMRGSIALGGAVGFNLLREFVPFLRPKR